MTQSTTDKRRLPVEIARIPLETPIWHPETMPAIVGYSTDSGEGMGYGKILDSAAKWLISTRAEDLGWGVTPGAPSSIVNTAEAIYVLKRAGYAEACRASSEFLKQRLFPSVEQYGPRVRYVAFALIALSDAGLLDDKPFIDQCKSWLLAARNQDGAWGHTSNDQSSAIFPTFLATWALADQNIQTNYFDSTVHWIASNITDRGWKLYAAGPSSAVATAYALLTVQLLHRDHQVLAVGRTLLSQVSHWGFDEEQIPGAVWKHHSYPWVVRALLTSGEDIFSPVIANAVRYINSLVCGVGWSEIPGQDAVTPRSQFWACVALDALNSAFIPSVEVPRIDAERTERQLLEPNFIKVAVHSQWAMIVPTRLYQTITYVLLAWAIFLISGAAEHIPFTPRLESLLALCAIFMSVYLVRKRRKYFRRVGNVVFATLGLLAGLDLWLGLSILNIVEKTHEAFDWVWQSVDWLVKHL